MNEACPTYEAPVAPTSPLIPGMREHLVSEKSSMGQWYAYLGFLVALEHLSAQQVRFDQRFLVRRRYQELRNDGQHEIVLYVLKFLPPVGPVSPWGPVGRASSQLRLHQGWRMLIYCSDLARGS